MTKCARCLLLAVAKDEQSGINEAETVYYGSALCRACLKLVYRLYGAEAGNLLTDREYGALFDSPKVSL